MIEGKGQSKGESRGEGKETCYDDEQVSTDMSEIMA